MKLKLGLEVGDMRCECVLEMDTMEQLKAAVPEALDTAQKQLDAYRNFVAKKTTLIEEFEKQNAL
jgi:hypothetical protein